MVALARWTHLDEEVGLQAQPQNGQPNPNRVEVVLDNEAFLNRDSSRAGIDEHRLFLDSRTLVVENALINRPEKVIRIGQDDLGTGSPTSTDSPFVGEFVGRFLFNQYFYNNYNTLRQLNGGEAGIRTLGGRKSSPDFESGPFDRSGTSPRESIPRGRIVAEHGAICQTHCLSAAPGWCAHRHSASAAFIESGVGKVQRRIRYPMIAETSDPPRTPTRMAT